MRNIPTNNHTPNCPIGWFGKYCLIKKIGEGSTSIVFLATDTELERQVAIKIFKVPPGYERAEFLEAVETCKTEAKTAARFEHTHIIRILDAGTLRGIPFIVMPFASGGSLYKQYALGTRLPLSLVISIVKQLAAGLQNAHDQGVVHCDVKPGNMFMDGKGKVLIGDFGIAKVQQKVSDSDGHQVMGTPEYMAPEQIVGYPVSASDQYALAAVAWLWLTGNYLFTGEMTHDILAQQVSAEPPSLQHLNPLIPEEVEMVLRKALSKEPTDRYASIQQFAEALEKASHIDPNQTTEPDTPAVQQHQTPATGTPPVNLSSPRQQRRPRRTSRLWLGILLGVLAIFLLSIIYLSFPLVPPVTVTINPKSVEHTETYSFTPISENASPSANQVYTRVIDVTFQTQTQGVNATGPIVATNARGLLTFYNSNVTPQTIPANTIVTTSNGVQLATDTDITVPAEQLPNFGQASVSAHAIKAGSGGNIPVSITPRPCCTADNTIQVVNYKAFQGGQDSQSGTVVQQSDLDRAITAANPSINKEVERRLSAKKRNNEMLDEQKFCSDTTVPSVPLGEKATTVSVQVTRHCSAWVYDQATASKLAIQQYNADTQKVLGNDYSLIKRATVKVIKIDLPDVKQGITLLQVLVSGLWSYKLSEKQKQHLLQSITGKSNAEAHHLLMSQSGIADATIQYNWPFSWLRHDTLPDRTEQFQLLVGAAIKEEK